MGVGVGMRWRRGADGMSESGAEQGPSGASAPLGLGQGGCVLSLVSPTPTPRAWTAGDWGGVVLNTNLEAEIPTAAQLGCTSGGTL